MKIDLIPDTGAEVLLQLQRISKGIDNLKLELAEKDKKILELEAKLKKYENEG